MKKEQEGHLGWYSLCTFCYFGAAGILSTYYYPFLQQQIGLELGEIGKLTSFGAMFSLISQPVLGSLFSKSSNKKRFMECYLLALLFIAVLFLLVDQKQIYGFAVLYGSISIPLIGTYEIYIEKIAKVHVFSYTKVRKWGSIGMGTITILGGTIIAAAAFQGLYLLGMFYLLACMLMVWKCFGEIPVQKEQKDRVSFGKMFSNRSVNIIYLMTFLGIGSYVGCDFAYSTYLGSLCTDIQTANQYFSMSTGIKIFLEFAAFILIGRFAAAQHRKRSLLLVFVCSAFRFLLISSGVLPLVILGDMVHCLVFPLFLTVIFPYLRVLMPDHLVAGCYSLVSVLMFGVSNFVFPVLMSQASEQFGYPVMYLLAAAFSVAALLLGYFCLPAERHDNV